jgi:glycerol-3-phosphate cytidylyltransferase
MAVVLTYGTFDLFHVGHLRLLERAKQLGDRLIVGVSTDEFNAVKGKRCFMPYANRSEIVAAIKPVDEVFAESNWDQKIDDIKKHKVDIFCMGSDWAGKFDFLNEYCRVVYLDRTTGIDSTSLRALARAFDKEALAKLGEAHAIIQDMLTRLNGN